MERIFLLEDDETLGQGIAIALESPERKVTRALSKAEAEKILAAESFNLLILDVNLPDGSGLDLLKDIRRSSAVPVILLTANDMELDEVTGLEAGADDYITKPFSLAVLRARVAAQLRRGDQKQPEAVELGPFAGRERQWSSQKPSSGCCGYWWKTGGALCPDLCWWTGCGRTGLNMWMKTPCPSP